MVITSTPLRHTDPWPDISEDRMFTRSDAGRIVVCLLRPSRHVSGAAIDRTLLDGDGTPVDRGTPVNATPEDSAGACYFAADNVSSEARQHRRVLAAALEEAGLVNYPTEWWHWSYGDRYWAFVTDQPAAIYSPVRGFGTTVARPGT